MDRLRGQQEVVIKALDPAVSEAAVGIAGATIMGDGRVVLILDVAALFEGRARAQPGGGGAADAAAPPRARRPERVRGLLRACARSPSARPPTRATSS